MRRMLEILNAEAGASAVEYSILAGSIAVVIVAAVFSIGDWTRGVFAGLLGLWP